MKKLFVLLLSLFLAVTLVACAIIPDGVLSRCRMGAKSLSRPVGYDTQEICITQEGDTAQSLTATTDTWFIIEEGNSRWAVLSHFGDMPVQKEVGQDDIYYIKPDAGLWQLSVEARRVGEYGNFSEGFFAAKNFSAIEEDGDILTLTFSNAYLQALQDETLAQIEVDLPQADSTLAEQMRQTQEFFIKNSPYLAGSLSVRFEAEGNIAETVQTLTQDVAQVAYEGEKQVIIGTQAVTTQITTCYETPALSEAEAVIDPLWQEAVAACG